MIDIRQAERAADVAKLVAMSPPDPEAGSGGERQRMVMFRRLLTSYLGAMQTCG